MSVYSRRYNVSSNMVSYYTDDPAEALRLYNSGLNTGYPAPWIAEGYGDYSDGPNDTTCVTRRTTGKVLPSTLEFLIVRAEVQKMKEKM